MKKKKILQVFKDNQTKKELKKKDWPKEQKK